MIDLNYSDILTHAPFASGNRFVYIDFVESPLYFNTSGSKKIPIIMFQSIYTTNTREQIHALRYENSQQFRGRAITKARFAEIFNISMQPVLVKVGALRGVMVAKGFIGILQPNGTIELLFVAAASKKPTTITDEDITLYVSKSLKAPAYRTLKAVVDETIARHNLDVVYTSSIDKFLGETIEYPKFRNLGEKKKYSQGLLSETIKKLTAA